MTNYNVEAYPYRWYTCPTCNEKFVSNAAHVIHCSTSCTNTDASRKWYAKNKVAWRIKQNARLKNDPAYREKNKQKCIEYRLRKKAKAKHG